MIWPDKKAVPGIYRRRLVGTYCWLDLLAQWNDEHALLAFGIHHRDLRGDGFLTWRAYAFDGGFLLAAVAMNRATIMAEFFRLLIIGGFFDRHRFAFLTYESVTTPLLDFLDFLLC